RAQQPCAGGVVDVVIDVGNQVGDPHDLPFDRARSQLGRHADRRPGLALRMLRDPVAHLPRQVQPLAVVLEAIDDAQALLVVVEAARHERVVDALMPGGFNHYERSEEHTSELQSLTNLVCRLLLEKKNTLNACTLAYT